MGVLGSHYYYYYVIIMRTRGRNRRRRRRRRKKRRRRKVCINSENKEAVKITTAYSGQNFGRKTNSALHANTSSQNYYLRSYQGKLQFK
jgi:hypothetical protein